jgi:serine/threonine protein kinase
MATRVFGNPAFNVVVSGKPQHYNGAAADSALPSQPPQPPVPHGRIRRPCQVGASRDGAEADTARAHPPWSQTIIHGWLQHTTATGPGCSVVPTTSTWPRRWCVLAGRYLVVSESAPAVGPGLWRCADMLSDPADVSRGLPRVVWACDVTVAGLSVAPWLDPAGLEPYTLALAIGSSTSGGEAVAAECAPASGPAGLAALHLFACADDSDATDWRRGIQSARAAALDAPCSLRWATPAWVTAWLLREGQAHAQAEAGRAPRSRRGSKHSATAAAPSPVATSWAWSIRLPDHPGCHVAGFSHDGAAPRSPGTGRSSARGFAGVAAVGEPPVAATLAGPHVGNPLAGYITSGGAAPSHAAAGAAWASPAATTAVGGVAQLAYTGLALATPSLPAATTHTRSRRRPIDAGIFASSPALPAAAGGGMPPVPPLMLSSPRDQVGIPPAGASVECGTPGETWSVRSSDSARTVEGASAQHAAAAVAHHSPPAPSLGGGVLLGAGAFAHVVRAVRAADGLPVAVKVMPKPRLSSGSATGGGGSLVGTTAARDYLRRWKVLANECMAMERVALQRLRPCTASATGLGSDAIDGGAHGGGAVHDPLPVLLEVRESEEEVFIVMGLVPGADLAQCVLGEAGAAAVPSTSAPLPVAQLLRPPAAEQDEQGGAFCAANLVATGATVPLSRFLSPHGGLTEPVARLVVRDVATALTRLAAAGVAHRDVKAENVRLVAVAVAPGSGNPLGPGFPAALSSGAGGWEAGTGAVVLRAVLLDLGFAHLTDVGSAAGEGVTTRGRGEPQLSRAAMRTLFGTRHAAAPELWAAAEAASAAAMSPTGGGGGSVAAGPAWYTAAVDAWGLGVVAYTALLGCLPFSELGGAAEQKRNVMEGRVQRPQPAWGNLSASATHLLTALLTVDPEHRLTTAQALSHPWLQESN